MTDEELSKALRGREPPVDSAHQARLEEKLLAAYDARVPRSARPGRAPWLRYATAFGFLLCLVTATQVTAEYKVEVGKRIQLVLPAGRELPPELAEKVSRAFTSESSRLVNVSVILRRTPEGATRLVVDVWGDGLAQADSGLERLRAMPELVDVPVEVTSLNGPVRDNLLGLVGHSLFRKGASPEEREQARQRLIEELRRREGEEVQVDVVEDAQGQKVRVKVRKPPHEPQSPPE